MALHLPEGQTERALADAEELLERLRNRRHGGLRLKDAAAETLLAAGRRERAAAVAGEGLEVAERWGAPGTIAPFRRVLGLARRDEQDLQAAVALSVLAPSGQKPPGACSRSVHTCVAPGLVRRPVSRCAGRSTWRTRSAPARSAARPRPSCERAARARGRCPTPASKASRRASGGSRSWSPRGAPTQRSLRRCSCPARRSRPTCAASSASST